ncbi:hypothetical protein JKF63_01316 [Porcisia hertigi]|uniref:EF-hand domain-containing protein n=1 Tax=Porcisia hertigi TaxID=2761500 RepID=A0A836HGA1_9TRYP|nr:hypothetical protein JKF63_01316 [Porcisia hertigi]
MFRSWGELTSCANEVFELFAEPLSVSGFTNRAAPLQDSVTGAEKGLSRVGLECAFYVLFGRYPTPSLIDECFASPSASASSVCCASTALPRPPPPNADGGPAMRVIPSYAVLHSDVGRASHRGIKCVVTHSSYLRFVMLCAEEEGNGLVMEKPQGNAAADVALAALSIDAQKAAQLQWWRQFQCVAGAKGFMTADDLRGIDLEGPFTEVQEVLAAQSTMRASDSLIAAQRKPTASRQASLVQHIFWVLDRDHDGAVRFDDVRPYLQES